MNYWDVQPCNIHHGTSAVGTPQWSQEVTFRKYLVEPHIPAFAEFSRWKGKRILDFGCGIGTDTLEFAKSGAYVDAVDTSAVSLNLAQERCSAYPVRFYFGCDPYDLIWSFGVLHHIKDPLPTLRYLHYKLKDGGELRIMLYARYSLKFLTGQQSEAQPDCPVVHTYTKRSARNLLSAAGFQVQSIEKKHIFPYKIDEYIRHRHIKHWWAPLISESLLGHHLLIVATK